MASTSTGSFAGAHIPPLVSTAPAGGAGTLSSPGTAVVFGGDDHNSDWQSGFRLRAGTWLEDGVGLDVGGFWLGQVKQRFAFGSTGDPGVFRPFFNTATGAEDAALVAFVDPVFGPVVSGRVAVSGPPPTCGASTPTTGPGGTPAWAGGSTPCAASATPGSTRNSTSTRT